MTTNLSTFFEAATPTLRRIAARYASDDPATADDLYQAMAETLTRRAHANPDFLAQKPAYIFRAAQLAALHALRLQATYRRFNSPLAQGEPDDDAAHPIPTVELIAAPSASPEAATVMAQDAFRILDALRKLTRRDRQIASLLYQGFKPSEIARELGIPRYTVSQRRQVIAAAARAAL